VTSPLNCIQEIAPRDKHYPWRVMLTCILLNQTHGRQVRPMLDQLWELLPDPRALSTMNEAKMTQLRELLRPLGFVNKRLHAIVRMTFDYERGVDPHNCYGMGQYGRDALDLFVYGKTDVKPRDTWLLPYLQWRLDGGPPVLWGQSETNEAS
jgi:methyl-CpG-binding domain protein 4